MLIVLDAHCDAAHSYAPVGEGITATSACLMRSHRERATAPLGFSPVASEMGSEDPDELNEETAARPSAAVPAPRVEIE